MTGRQEENQPLSSCLSWQPGFTTMTRLQSSFSRLVLILILMLGLTPTLPAAPQPAVSPVYAEWLSNVNVGRPSNRTTVIRIAALGMALALFIMYYKKH
jgi:hypothetical protein